MTRSKRREAQARGKRGETLCALWLQMRGWRVLARGYVAGRGTGAGEVDLIAKRGRILAFVEIKARKTAEDAAYAVTPAQQARIVRGAEAFLASRPDLNGLDCRFDAMLVTPSRPPKHLPDAWRPEWC